MRRVLSMVLVLSFAAGRAEAQSADSSTLAEQLFNQGRDLTRANQWPAACAKFEASLRYDSALGTRLNLATCYEHIGKLASAWGLYRESSELASKAGDVKRRDYAQKQAAALEPRLPRLAVAPPARQPADFIVKRDGTAIDAGALGAALYVDPGPHEVTASAPGFEAFTQTVMLAEGKAETLVLPDLKALAIPQPPTETDDHVAASQPEMASSAENKLTAKQPQGIFTVRRKISIGVVSVSVVSLVTGVVLGTTAKEKQSDAFKLCPSLATPCTQADQSNALLQSSRSRAFVANVAFGIAAAAAIGAGTLWLIGAPDTEHRKHLSIAPDIATHAAWVVVVGRL